MADPFVAEIRIFPFYFAPKGWAFCDGQIMPVSQNTALFSLIGTYYGGNGKSTFALPNMQGNAPMNQGQGPGLSNRDLGETGGTPNVTLQIGEIPLHTHGMTTQGGFVGEERLPADRSFAQTTSVGGNLYGPASNLMPMAQQALQIVGSSQPHNNMMPCLTLNFCIALQGVYPPRS